MDTTVGKDQLIVIGVLVVLAVILAGIWYFGQRRETPKEELKYTSFAKDEAARHRKLKQEQYVRDLESAIEDVVRMAESITDGEERNGWFLYAQKLRVRQLTIVQEIQDKEWRKVRGDSLTREELQAIEDVALREIRRMERERNY